MCETAHALQERVLVYRGPGRRVYEERARPVLQEPTDAIARITASTILRHRPAHPEGQCALGDAQ